MVRLRSSVVATAVRLVAAALAMRLSGQVSPATAAGFPTFPATRCAPDSILAGTICLDRWEASVWRVPDAATANARLVRSIQLGRATRADLVAGGATQLGVANGDLTPCAANGQNCADDVYAVSLEAETPAANITWFQAQEACANARKRLPTSAEWQVGANGTPDPGTDDGTTDCDIASDSLALTGARRACVSARGAFDMVGNLAEWVADWVPAPTSCPGWGSFSDDEMCLAGAATAMPSPGALVRGGAFVSIDREHAGVFAVHAFPPFHHNNFVGFRCAR